MDKDLEWLARNVCEWPSEAKVHSHGIGWNGFNRDKRPPDFIRRVDPLSKEFTKSEWLQARKDLGLEPSGISEADEEECIKLAESRMNDESVKTSIDELRADANDEVQDFEDMVNHPPHYQSDNGIECIDAIRAALGLDGFVAHCRGTAIKYCWRSGKKQAHAEDLRKAAWYLNEAADALEEQ